MMKIRDLSQRKMELRGTLEDFVPKNHLLRKIDSAVDLSFIYEKVKDLYSPIGKASIDPVVLFKIVILQYVFGIRSMRETIAQIEVNLAFRWYLGYGLDEKVPHFSTFGKNYIRRFEGKTIFQDIFSKILEEVIECNFVDTKNIFIDGTHIKASANTKKTKKEVVDSSVKFYEEELIEEINNDRVNHGKKPFEKVEQEAKSKETLVSTTDPECGIFHKGEHKKVLAYSANTACDKNNYILGFEVTPGNFHDSVVFPKLYSSLIATYSGIQNIVVDAGYKIPAIAKMIFDNGNLPIMPYKRPMTKSGFFKKHEYVFDEYYDCYLCPNDQVLKYSTTNREGYKEYKSDAKICKNCPLIKKCTESKNSTKVVIRHVWEKYIEMAEDVRHTEGIKEIYSLRSQTIERVFADAKEKHGMRYTQYRGLAKVKMELTLKFACMNLKKLALWKSKLGMLA